MKTWGLKAGSFLFILYSLAVTGCSKEKSAGQPPSDTSGTPSTPVAGSLTSGTWYVSLFSEKAVNHTGIFGGYVFTFQPGGKLLAVKSGNTTTGTWVEDNSTHRLHINLGPETDNNSPLGELSDDWVVTAKTATKITLGDDNSSTNEVVELSKK
jgi:hypothetical protein